MQPADHQANSADDRRAPCSGDRCLYACVGKSLNPHVSRQRVWKIVTTAYRERGAQGISLFTKADTFRCYDKDSGDADGLTGHQEVYT
jgi:hypothetical protein